MSTEKLSAIGADLMTLRRQIRQALLAQVHSTPDLDESMVLSRCLVESTRKDHPEFADLHDLYCEVGAMLAVIIK